MNIEDFRKFAATPGYFAVASIAAVGIGAVVGFAVDRIFSEDDEACTDDGEVENVYAPPKLYEVEGIEENTDPDKMINDAFVKPDISNMTDYTKYFDKSKNYNTAQVEKDIPEEEDGEDWSELITKDEFLKSTGNEDGYISVTGGYFPVDGILAGWDGDLVEKKPEESVGHKAIKQFDDPSVTVVYVRNTQLKVLYEIIKYDEAFKDLKDDPTVTDPSGDSGMA